MKLANTVSFLFDFYLNGYKVKCLIIYNKDDV